MSLSDRRKKRFINEGEVSEVPGRRKRTEVVRSDDDFDDAVRRLKDLYGHLAGEGTTAYLTLSVKHGG